MINLNEEEKKKIIEISKNFVEIHQEIMKVEELMKEMESKSSTLIEKLESCRDEEFRFVSELSDKYGNGTLNPLTLSWEISKEKKETV